MGVYPVWIYLNSGRTFENLEELAMKKHSQDVIVLVLSKRSLLSVINTALVLVAVLFCLRNLLYYVSYRIDLQPFAILAFTETDERIGTMNGIIVGNSRDSELADDVYGFKDAKNDNSISVWRLTASDYTYRLQFEDEDRVSETITLEPDSSYKGKFEVQSSYFSKEVGYNYTGEGELMSISFNIPRPYSWHGQDGFSLRSYYQINWDVGGMPLLLHIIYCVTHLVVIVSLVHAIIPRKGKTAHAAAETESESLAYLPDPRR